MNRVIIGELDCIRKSKNKSYISLICHRKKLDDSVTNLFTFCQFSPSIYLPNGYICPQKLCDVIHCLTLRSIFTKFCVLNILL